VDWEGVKAIAIPIMSKYAARTNGSSLKVLDLSLSWSFFSSDPEWGDMQARYIVPELEENLQAFDVQVVMLKGQVEVVPRRLHKGVVVKRLLREVSARDGKFPAFIMCIGDDKSDEPMFQEVFSFLGDQVAPEAASQAELLPLGDATSSHHAGSSADLELPKFDPKEPQYAFTFTVGKKKSIAQQFVHDTLDVERLLSTVAGTSHEDAKLRGELARSMSNESDSRASTTFYDL